MTGDVSLGDNVKAKFGAGDDLQIYHDGSHSRIVDAGTGNLSLQGNDLRIKNSDASATYIQAANGGAVILHHDNAIALATTATGIDVTGSVTCDGFTSTGIDDNATSTAITIDASENVEINTGNLVIGTSGKGIDFSATSDGSGTMTSEVLDDYETGTWTPAAGDGATTFVHTSQLGEYVKVGKQVTVSCVVKWSGIGSVGSGLFRIAGLPFPFSSTTGTRYGAALGNVKEVNNNGGQLVLAGDNGVSHISFYSIHDNATYIAVAANSNDNVAGFAQFSATYLTD
jgi:hypothetical protein